MTRSSRARAGRRDSVADPGALGEPMEGRQLLALVTERQGEGSGPRRVRDRRRAEALLRAPEQAIELDVGRSSRCASAIAASELTFATALSPCRKAIVASAERPVSKDGT
jgi:hypothetical protein